MCRISKWGDKICATLINKWGHIIESYHKIQNAFKRDDKGKLIINEFTNPTFEQLKDIQWYYTEKIDGTSIWVIWDGEKIIFKGRKENAQISVRYMIKKVIMYIP